MAETTEQSTATEGATKPAAQARGSRRKLQGRVVNDTTKEGRARKTVVVEVIRRFRDPVYGKYVKTRKKYHAHDEAETYVTGDVVEIRESRPMSATKRWVVSRLVERPEKV